MAGIVMNLSSMRGEVILAAADADVLGKTLREKNLHLTVDKSFYGEAKVSETTYISSLRICTIANLVGKRVIELAISEGFVDPDNVITIQGIPHAQYARFTV
ncbi:MAG: DUF424 domain-containing protein [Candidatus Thermoplasmatota archaeon]|jgi:hypothetical protein|nr:DUF424 domain-containing protein [Candidatus Thermoplasmatota archaeon]MCL5793740.1 DUF424 domain-containing protein [Candidatus Thermoplasmatota archaeon]